MLQYYVDFWKNYFNFSGRSRRAAFWYAWLMNLIVSFLIALVDVLLGLGFLTDLYSIAIFIPSLAIEMRRLHDIGKSGAWVLLSFIPVVGIIILLIWFCREGDHGGNAYGPDPKAVQVL